MRKLKTLLQSKKTYIIAFFVVSFYVLFATKIIKYKSYYENEDVILTGKVISYSMSEDKPVMDIKAKEKIRVNYYDKFKVQVGDVVKVSGKLSDAKNNTIPNTFNYKKYLYNLKIYKVLKADKIEIVSNNSNMFTNIKNLIINRCQNNAYLQMFIIGDKSNFDDSVYNNFKQIGAAHLLAISGMHVSVLVGILSKLLKRTNQIKADIVISLFLFFYAYIVNYSASIMRTTFFFVLNKINKQFNLNLSNIKILFWTAMIILIINPFYLHHIGFIYSFAAVFSILFTQKYFRFNYIYNLLVISFWTLLFSLPITINLNYEINLISLFSNLILIPFVTFIFYPMALLTFIFPFVSGIFNCVAFLMNSIVGVLSSINILNICIPKMPGCIILIYYIALIFFAYFGYKRFLFLLISILIGNKFLYKVDNRTYVLNIDVGQGDSSVIISSFQKQVVLIDTGGTISFDKSNSYFVSNNIMLFLKSRGINKLSSLILTHGDYDHIGEAINLVENFKVEKVIFNCGEYNDLEKELIKTLNKKKIQYYSCIKELNIVNNKLYFLNNKDYGNENDNSSVIYTELNNHKFLFMGDAGIEVEEDLIEKYNLQDIDVLKVGHHGSKTSSGKEFIDEVNPKYSIISVGKNNRYGHPNDSVLGNLNNSKIYRTDQDGSILFKIKKDKLKIETCTP